MNPVFGHGHLRLYLLSLLAEHPRHGYELIQALSERFGGTYSPSAGTIYPRLAKLEDEGLVTKSTDGRKTVYEITDAGRAELAARHDELTSIEDSVTDSVRLLADGVRAGVRDAMRSLRADLASAARESRESSAAGSSSRFSSSGVKTPSYGLPNDGAAANEGSAPGAAGDAGTATDGGAGTNNGAAAGAGATAGDFSTDDVGQPTAQQLRQNNADAIREIELALTGFRASVRTDLRKFAVRGTVPPSAVTTFTTELARLKAELQANLRA